MTGAGTTPAGTAGVLTHLTALRVEVQVEQWVAEPVTWAERSRERDPRPPVSFTGTLGDFDSDPETGRGKSVQALRRAPDAPADQLRGILTDALRGHFMHVTATAPALLRLRLWTIQEAGCSQPGRAGGDRVPLARAAASGPVPGSHGRGLAGGGGGLALQRRAHRDPPGDAHGGR
jgi:hypothetical protein